MSDGLLRWSDVDLPAVNKAFDEWMRERDEAASRKRLERAFGPVPEPVVVLCEEVQPKRPGPVTQWRFWCGWCRKWHLHGASPGHRASHCVNEDSPYRRSGYILKMKRNAQRDRR